MLVVALGLTVLGFVFLVAAVATGHIAWAWACIVVGALGLALLLVDLVRGRSGREDRSTDEAPDASHEGTVDDPDATDADTDGESDAPEEADSRTDG